MHAMPTRADIPPINETIADERQKWARHYGAHPYFTRRSASVVRAYLERYSQEGDTVLDPFGGSGVTAIEAFLLGRHAIQNDLNPLANFLARAIADTRLPSLRPLQAAFARVAAACEDTLRSLETASDTAVADTLAGLPLPENIALPRTSDAARFHDLFTPRQLAALAVLKRQIDREPDEPARLALLLAWSATAAKLNRTFISAQGRAASRGGASIFSIYRYKVAKAPVELPLWETFRGRHLNILAAKREILETRDHFNRNRHDGWRLDSDQHFIVMAEDAATLAGPVRPESVDYIFTDPPYGAFIAYLDLSTLWNHWLGFPVGAASRANEIIVGGDLGLSEEHYRSRLAASIRACLEVLKPDRWFSVVFQHWDVRYFETILRTATGCGAELRAAVTQEREVIWSMHKKKNRESVLAGEMILTFYKGAGEMRDPETREAQPCLLHELLDTILRNDPADEMTSQSLFNRLVLAAWQRQSLSQLSVPREAFSRELQARGWAYDERRHVWRKRTPAADTSMPLWEA